MSLIGMFAFVVFSIFQRDKVYGKGRGSYCISDMNSEFKCKLKLKCRLHIENKENNIIVYAKGEKLTFEDVVWLLSSSESEDRTDIYVGFKWWIWTFIRYNENEDWFISEIERYNFLGNYIEIY